MAGCPRCGAQAAEDARFCPACGTALADLLPSAREVRKTVTILFSDVAGSTNLGERLDPESVRRVMARYFDEMSVVIERHGGTVEKFIGDAIMAVFGIPVVHEDDALRAVRAAVEMRDVLASLNDRLDEELGVRIATRTGVNTGEVIAGDASTRQKLATGDAVNVAARLEQKAGPGEILVGRDTYAVVREAVECEAVEPLSVKGKSQPLTAYRLAGVTPTEFPGRRLDSPLVDRLRETELLGQAFERAVADRSCRLFTLIGAAGVGKSRLAAELVGALGERATVLKGRCLPYGEGITYWPVVEAVRGAARIVDEDPPELVQRKLAELVGEDEDAPLVVEHVAQLLGVGESAASSEQTFWSVRKLLEGVARRGPVVLVLEDLHWAEPKLLDLVEYLGGWCRDSPLLVVCLARPDLLDARPAWGREPWASIVQLEPLGEEDCGVLIASRLGTVELDDAARTRVLEAAEGNPLFVEQMLAMIAEGGSAEGESAVPPTIQSVLAARLDQLPDDERRVIGTASVMGRQFWWEALGALLPAELAPRASELLMALVRKEMIAPEQGESGREHRFRFRHILIRDTAYAAVPLGARSQLHERFADWLDRHTGEYDEIVGYHLEQAYRLRGQLGTPEEGSSELAARAGRSLGAAGRRALARGDMPAALSLLGRASALLPELSAERLALLPALAEAARATGDLGRADTVLCEAVTRAAEAGDERLETVARIDREELFLYIDPTSRRERVLQTARRAVRLFEELGDESGLARAWSLRAQQCWGLCRYAEMEETLERALEHAGRAGAERVRALILTGLTRAALLGPAPVDAAGARCERILTEARGDPALEAVTVAMIGGLEGMLGRFDDARARIGRSRALGEEFGLMTWLAALPLYSGPVELLADDPEAAERALREGCRALREMGELGRFSTEAAFLAQALYAQGRYEEAERQTELSADAATPDDSFSQIAWRGTRAKTLARRGELERAEALAREAVALAEETDGLNLHGDVLLDLAEVLRLAGRPSEAEAAARMALALYERKGNLVSAARARAAVGEEARRA